MLLLWSGQPFSAAADIDQLAESDKRILVSVSSDEIQGDEYSGLTSPAPSWSGRYVAFMSQATNLVVGPQSNLADVFVRDVEAGTTQLVSLTNMDTPAYYGGSEPSISGNGRYVAFVSAMIHKGGRHDNSVYMRDRLRGTTTLISRTTRGDKAIGSVRPAVSRDGSTVVFDSRSRRLVPGDTNTRSDVFVWDADTESIRRVSVSSAGTQALGTSHEAAVSANGRYVAYQSNAANLDGGEAGRRDYDVFVYDRISRRTTRVSVSRDGMDGNGDSQRPSLSRNGKYVLFDSEADNLVLGDRNSSGDVFRLNRVTGVIRRASIRSDGVEGDAGGGLAGSAMTLSGDGRYATFESSSTDLVGPGQPFAWRNVYLHDYATKVTTRVSISPRSTSSARYSGGATISGNGAAVTYLSKTGNQVEEDTNRREDVFLYRR